MNDATWTETMLSLLAHMDLLPGRVWARRRAVRYLLKRLGR